MNYSQKLAQQAGLAVQPIIGEFTAPDQPAINDPVRAQIKARNALKQAVALSYYPAVIWGFAGAISGGFMGLHTLALILVVSALFWLPAGLAFRECRTVLHILNCQDIYRHQVASAVWGMTAMTLFVWLPIWTLLLFCADVTILPPWSIVGGATSVLLTILRYSGRVRKQYEKPKRFQWVEAWG